MSDKKLIIGGYIYEFFMYHSYIKTDLVSNYHKYILLIYLLYYKSKIKNDNFELDLLIYNLFKPKTDKESYYEVKNLVDEILKFEKLYNIIRPYFLLEDQSVKLLSRLIKIVNKPPIIKLYGTRTYYPVLGNLNNLIMPPAPVYKPKVILLDIEGRIVKLADELKNPIIVADYDNQITFEATDIKENIPNIQFDLKDPDEGLYESTQEFRLLGIPFFNIDVRAPFIKMIPENINVYFVDKDTNEFLSDLFNSYYKVPGLVPGVNYEINLGGNDVILKSVKYEDALPILTEDQCQVPIMDYNYELIKCIPYNTTHVTFYLRNRFLGLRDNLNYANRGPDEFDRPYTGGKCFPLNYIASKKTPSRVYFTQKDDPEQCEEINYLFDIKLFVQNTDCILFAGGKRSRRTPQLHFFRKNTNRRIKFGRNNPLTCGVFRKVFEPITRRERGIDVVEQAGTTEDFDFINGDIISNIEFGLSAIPFLKSINPYFKVINCNDRSFINKEYVFKLYDETDGSYSDYNIFNPPDNIFKAKAQQERRKVAP